MYEYEHALGKEATSEFLFVCFIGWFSPTKLFPLTCDVSRLHFSLRVHFFLLIFLNQNFAFANFELTLQLSSNNMNGGFLLLRFVNPFLILNHGSNVLLFYWVGIFSLLILYVMISMYIRPDKTPSYCMLYLCSWSFKLRNLISYTGCYL